jgi:hypothetical protein
VWFSSTRDSRMAPKRYASPRRASAASNCGRRVVTVGYHLTRRWDTLGTRRAMSVSIRMEKRNSIGMTAKVASYICSALIRRDCTSAVRPFNDVEDDRQRTCRCLP